MPAIPGTLWWDPGPVQPPPGRPYPGDMSTHRYALLPLAGATVLLLAWASRPGRAADGEGPPLDREVHETVKTATFALG